MLSTVVMLRIVFVTSIINIIAILLVVLSCRCINIWKVTSVLSRYPWFKRYFRWHCFLWYVFLPSVIIHAVLALILLGVPW